MLDPVWVATEAAAKLKITVEQAQPSADAAVEYIATYTGILAADLPADDAQLNIGAPLMAMRIYQDAGTPNGSTSSFDGFSAGLFTPRFLGSHLDEYFRNLPGATAGFA